MPLCFYHRNVFIPEIMAIMEAIDKTIYVKRSNPTELSLSYFGGVLLPYCGHRLDYEKCMEGACPYSKEPG